MIDPDPKHCRLAKIFAESRDLRMVTMNKIDLLTPVQLSRTDFLILSFDWEVSNGIDLIEDMMLMTRCPVPTVLFSSSIDYTGLECLLPPFVRKFSLIDEDPREAIISALKMWDREVTDLRMAGA